MELIALLATLFFASSVGVFAARRINHALIAYPVAAILTAATLALLYAALNELYWRGFFPDSAPATNFTGTN